MELRQLEYFVAVAEEASFTRAAQRVRISQSGVSAQVRQLERELGVVLFDRSTRSTRLTAAGEALLDHARTTLGGAAAMRSTADDLAGLVRGQLRLGMVIGCAVTPLFEALATFGHAHPSVEVSVTEGNSDALLDAVRCGAVDVALAGVAGTPPADLASLTLIEEGLSALLAPGHRLVDARRLSVGDLAGERLVCMPIGTGVRSVLEQACAAVGVHAQVTVVASAAGAIADLASRNVGIGVLSASMARGYAGQAHVRAIDGVDVPAVLAVVWRPAPNRVVQEFVARAREAFAVPAADR